MNGSKKQELFQEIYQCYLKTKADDTYIKMMSIREITKSVTEPAKFKKIVSNYDKKELTAYIVFLLSKNKISMTQKNQILAITSIMPECLCAAVIIMAFKNNI